MRHNIDRQTETAMLERASFAQSNTSDCIARARALAPLITAQAARIEQEREIAPEVLAALHDAQLFRMLIPKSCDGWEVEPATFMQAIEELAKADGSTAWCVAQASGCSMAAAYVEPEVAREIFGDARAGRAWGAGGREPQGGGGRWRLSGVRELELRERHQARRLARLSLPRRRGGRHAASWSRRQAGRTHHAHPQNERDDQRHLARRRPQRHRQRQLRDRGPVCPECLYLHPRIRR